eukprot:3680654-Rhodomonas_salina.1
MSTTVAGPSQHTHKAFTRLRPCTHYLARRGPSAQRSATPHLRVHRPERRTHWLGSQLHTNFPKFRAAVTNRCRKSAQTPGRVPTAVRDAVPRH